MPEMEKPEDITFASATQKMAEATKVNPRLPLTIEKGDKISRWRYLFKILSNPIHFPWTDEEDDPNNPGSKIEVIKHGFSMNVQVLDFVQDPGYKGEPIIPNGEYNVPFSFRPPINGKAQKQSSLTNVITALWEKCSGNLVGQTVDLYTTNYPHPKHGKTRKYNASLVEGNITSLRHLGKPSDKSDESDDDE